jgi:hypothetical protein
VRRAVIPIEAIIVGETELPVYLRIAEKAKHLRELGMSDRAIARAIEVSDKRSLKPQARSEPSSRACRTRRNCRD